MTKETEFTQKLDLLGSNLVLWPEEDQQRFILFAQTKEGQALIEEVRSLETVLSELKLEINTVDIDDTQRAALYSLSESPQQTFPKSKGTVFRKLSSLFEDAAASLTNKAIWTQVGSMSAALVIGLYLGIQPLTDVSVEMDESYDLSSDLFSDSYLTELIDEGGED
ncbi:hypothetical protein QGN29_04760 [Temperatibacter marinus]|uniref:Uncharacterized protein n=1 Tax=Temperatibacter marinus TaxID=1456591 RepID=A0AA52EJ04_9PROT|nr:hypothetical protein [Temperatibacter marinus]WND03685.1 hypothetical protein QGN29_04760 [Temperatibacter marinus]